MVRVTVTDSGQGVLAVADFDQGERYKVMLAIVAALDAGYRSIHVRTDLEEHSCAAL